MLPPTIDTTTNTTKRVRDDSDVEPESILKCLKKSDVESGDDDEEVDIFSEESKKLLATMVSTCKGCGGFCICRPCLEKYKPTLKYSSIDRNVDKEIDQKNPTLCERNEDTCENDYDSVGRLPCTVCKRYNDEEKEVSEWKLPVDAHWDMICDYNCCPRCMASISSEICPVCKKDNDI